MYVIRLTLLHLFICLTSSQTQPGENEDSVPAESRYGKPLAVWKQRFAEGLKQLNDAGKDIQAAKDKLHNIDLTLENIYAKDLKSLTILRKSILKEIKSASHRKPSPKILRCIDSYFNNANHLVTKFINDVSKCDDSQKYSGRRKISLAESKHSQAVDMLKQRMSEHEECGCIFIVCGCGLDSDKVEEALNTVNEAKAAAKDALAVFDEYELRDCVHRIITIARHNVTEFGSKYQACRKK